MPTPLEDFRRWRQGLTTLEFVSAMRPVNAEVLGRDAAANRVNAAQMTASGFQLARIQPLLGRVLLDQDARAGARPVVVLGFALWKSAFASDPDVIGQSIQVDGTPRTVVGVMPDGFRFPMNQRLWLPLDTDAVGEETPESEVFVFARLVPGATLDRARSDVGAIGCVRRAPVPAASAPLEPRVVPYAAGFFPDVHANAWAGSLIFLVAALLLVPPCANIAILVYARTVTRREEFAARTALGASRGRIVMQLFVELLVLAAGAGIAGLLLARQLSGAERLARIVMPTAQPQNLPFWMDFAPSLPTVAGVAGLSVLAAALAGGVPAWQATGRWRRAGLSVPGSRGTGTRLGTTWMVLLAMQVALALAILPSAAEMIWGIVRPALVGPALPLEQYVTAALIVDGDASRAATLGRQVVAQLAAEGGVAGVTVSASALMLEPQADIQLESNPGGLDSARFNVVDDHFLDVFAARLLAGRRFEAADFQPGSAAVIVNRSFVTEIIGSKPVLGQRVRYKDPKAPAGTFDIIGVVADILGNNDGPMMFHPMTTATQPAAVTVRGTAGATVAAGRLRGAAARLDPQLHLGRLQTLDEMFWQRQSVVHAFGFVLGAVVVIAVLFSMAGIYTLMTFVVAQRRHEIGVRAALGARPRRLIAGTFGRALTPLLIGGVCGGVMAMGLNGLLPIDEAGGVRIPGVVPVSVVLMILFALLAVAGPARRAIRVNPTEALKLS
jgi:predicted permease